VDRAVYPLPLMPTGSEIAATAKRFVGVPYLWGGASPFGLDCSGFVQMVHKLHGVLLPRDAYLQAQDNSFRDVKPEVVMAGDLLFFGSAQDALSERSITHVGIALAGGRFIHSSGGAGVNISEISDPYYAPMLRMARRLI
jgi:gamma-D-glutamyl-L-lysine dipeptidyl-peptidase